MGRAHTLLNHLFSQFTRSLGIFLRTIRAFFTRRLTGLVARLRRLTNFSRSATKVAAGSLQAAASAVKKPTGRDDYVETSRLFIAKSFLVKLVVVLAALGLIVYFLIWPFVLSHFLTAHFYVEDDRVETWSGRVIVYADEDKTVPLYAGRLENGLLQGEGQAYDENGVLCYEGQFRDGLRSGSGAAYADGVLVYQGQFADDVYEGSGTACADGQVVYEGQFSGGAYEGRGTEYEGGVPVYEGSFAGGLRDGDGTEYHASGQPAYRGQFAAGVREGTGTEYDTDGQTVYEGSFSQGVYSGSGRLYLGENQWIDADFQDGAPSGTVQWYRNDRLYYEGEWSDGRPEGYGVLYGRAGDVLYQGQFSGGTVDGAWLLELTPDDLRAALGSQAETAENSAGGFLIQSGALGLTALCSYQTGEADAQVYAVYVTAPSESGWAALLPGDDAVTLDAWDGDTTAWEGTVDFTPPDGMNLPAGRYDARGITGDGWTALCLCPGDQAVLLGWVRQGAAPEVLDVSAMTDDDSEENAQRMESFLASLQLGEGSAAASAAGSDYYGTTDPSEALAACTDAAQAEALVDAMVAYWAQAERQAALEENLTRAEELLAEARSSLAMGTGTQAAVDTLEARVRELESGIQSCQAQRTLAQLQGQEAGCESVADYALGSLLICFDPSTVDASQLSLAATAYAQATGGDAAAAEQAAMTSLVALTEAYSQVQSALSAYQAAETAAQSAAGAFATGSGDKSAWYDALSSQADARSALCQTLAAFAQEANTLNGCTGGWVSRNQDWYAGALEPLFQAAAQAGETAETAQGAVSIEELLGASGDAA